MFRARSRRLLWPIAAIALIVTAHALSGSFKPTCGPWGCVVPEGKVAQRYRE